MDLETKSIVRTAYLRCEGACGNGTRRGRVTTHAFDAVHGKEDQLHSFLIFRCMDCSGARIWGCVDRYTGQALDRELRANSI